MRWFPDLASAAFCETVELRRKILEKQSTKNSFAYRSLEPSSAEFIAALAAGINSRNIVQVGCGISTIALAVVAQATGGFLISIHTDESKQEIVRHHINYLGLLQFVEFIVSEPSKVLLTRKNIDFAHFTGDPKDYIELFDLLNLNNGAVVTADNALSEASSEYIRHVRRQPGMDSSTLPLARGIEVTKVASWEAFKAGRRVYSGVIEEGESAIRPVSSRCEEIATSAFPLGYFLSENVKDEEADACTSEKDPSAASSPIILPEKAFTRSKPRSCEVDSSGSILEGPQGSFTGSDVELDAQSCPSGSKDHFLDLRQPRVQSNTTENSPSHSGSNDGEVDPCCKQIIASSVFDVHFRNHATATQVSITGVNQDMLLSDITTAFSDMGVSVKTANISTLDDFIEDVFFVVDAKSGAPIHPSRWDAVKDRILQKIGQRYVESSSSEGEG